MKAIKRVLFALCFFLLAGSTYAAERNTINVYDSNGNEICDIYGLESISGNIELSECEDEDVDIYAAFYSETELLSVEKFSLAKGEKSIDFSIQLQENIEKIRIFAWNKNQVPVCNEKKFGREKSIQIKGTYAPGQMLYLEANVEINKVEWLVSDYADGEYRFAGEGLSIRTPRTTWNGAEPNIEADRYYVAEVTLKDGNVIKTKPVYIRGMLWSDYCFHNANNNTHVFDAEQIKSLRTDTNPDYMFTVGNQKFIVLDTFENSDTSRYKVMAEYTYGKHTYPVHSFSEDTEKEFQDFILNQLPESIKRHIDMNAYFIGSFSGWMSYEASSMGIGVPSVKDLLDYKSIIGIKTYNINDLKTPVSFGTNSLSGVDGLLSYEIGADSTVSVNASSRCFYEACAEIRPVFYLDKDFFYDECADINDIGKNVVAFTDTEDNSKVNMSGLKKAFNVDNVLRKNELEIQIESDRRKQGTILVYCDGAKKYHNTMLFKNKEKRNVNINELTNGKHEIKVYINGVLKLDDVVRVLPEVKETLFESVTRRLGIAGANAVSENNDAAQLGANRLEFSWDRGENEKGIYNIEYEKDIENAKESGSEIIALVDYNNKLYSGSENLQKGLNSKNEIDAYTNFVKAIQGKYSENSPIKYFEIWNEPNGMWKNNSYKNYEYLTEVSSLGLKQNNPKENIAVGAISEGDHKFMEYIMVNGGYPYMDAVSNHPYIRPDKVDERYDSMLSSMEQIITKYGGWKEQIITEVGWPTHDGGISREQAAIELVKQAATADYYDIEINQYYCNSDNVTNYSNLYAEDNFGVFYNTHGEFKPSAYSISAFANETVGAIFCGKIMFADKDIQCYAYLRDNRLFCIIWSKSGMKNISFDGEILDASDINGNTLGSGSEFEIGEAPIYLHGLSEKWIINSLAENMQNYINLYIQSSVFDESKNNKGFEEAKKMLQSGVESAGALAQKEDLSAQDVLSELINHYKIGIEIINLKKCGELEISDAQLSGMTFVNHWGGVLLGNLYILISNNDENGATENKILSQAEIAIQNKKGDNTLCFSDAILKYAEKYAAKVEKLKSVTGSNVMKSAAITAWDKMACMLAETAVAMSDSETVGYDNVLVQLPSAEYKKLSAGEKGVVYVSIYNFRNSTNLNGYIEVLDSNGTCITKSGNFTVYPEKNTKKAMSFTMPQVNDNTCYIRIIENGREISGHGLILD